jgi:putative peptidoglycan lipid II flippase
MSLALGKKSIIKKTIEVGFSTLLSRFLGIWREMLTVQFLGDKVILDAFATAFKVPNSLRKIFAEGALAAAFIPTLVRMKKRDETEQINRLMTLSFLLIEGVLIALCILMFWQAQWLIRIIAPGWFVGTQTASFLGFPIPAAWAGLGTPIEQVQYAISFFRILIAFIVFLSSSSLLAGALQSVNHFFVPAFSPVLLNIVWVAGLLLGLYYHLSAESLCYFILLGGLLQFLLHLFVYYKLQFSFERVTEKTWDYFREIMNKFFPCLFSMSISEISLFIDTSFASYLPDGSIYLIYLGNRFMGIPQGVFATAFSTILLPHFSRVHMYAPKRMSYYLLEVTKFVTWVTLPAMIIMSFFAEKIFVTLFLSKKFTIDQAAEAQWILIAFLAGLFCLAMNKILLNMYYALHNTRIPAWVTVIGIVVNVTFNFLFIAKLQATGLALATTISAALQTILFIIFLRIFFGFRFYYGKFFIFLARYGAQLGIILSGAWTVYYALSVWIATFPASLSNFFLNKIGFWLWVGPLCGVVALLLYMTRRYFKVEMHFLD